MLRVARGFITFCLFSARAEGENESHSSVADDVLAKNKITTAYFELNSLDDWYHYISCLYERK
jgi:hypothetical protein